MKRRFWIVANGVGGWIDAVLAVLFRKSLRQQKRETTESYQAFLTNMSEKVAGAAGGIGEFTVRAAQLERHLKSQKADQRRDTVAYAGMADKETPAAKALYKKMISQAKLVTASEKLLANTNRQIADMQRRQQGAESRRQDIDIQRQEADFEAEALVQRGDFAEMREDIAKAQLAAQGVIESSGAKLVDHTDAMERQVGRMEGRAEAYERMAGDTNEYVDDETQEQQFASLSEDEQKTLAAAFQEAGITVPVVSTSSDQAASAGS